MHPLKKWNASAYSCATNIVVNGYIHGQKEIHNQSKFLHRTDLRPIFMTECGVGGSESWSFASPFFSCNHDGKENKYEIKQSEREREISSKHNFQMYVEN